MNLLQRTLIEKTGNDNGFEHIRTSERDAVILASARHPHSATINMESGRYLVCFHPPSSSLQQELQRSFPAISLNSAGQFQMSDEAGLALLLRRAACLSRALPSQAADDYLLQVASELAAMTPDVAGTEVERMVRQRIGQNRFREAMLDYWGHACAVTGIAIPAVLRASHAKPWAECVTDAE